MMKQFLYEKDYVNYRKKDQTYHYLIQVLMIMIIYRIWKEGVVPYYRKEIALSELFLPILLILACVLLSYGVYTILKKYLHMIEYQKEEVLIDGILLGLLLPLHTPILFLLSAHFFTVMVGRYCYRGKILVSPVLIGIMGMLGLAVWFLFTRFHISSSMQLLNSYIELSNLSHFSLKSIWFGLTDSLVTRTSPLLTMICFLFLISKKVIKWRIPVYFIGSYFILLVISHYFISTTLLSIMKQLGASNLIFIIIFVATDRRSTPVTDSGQILFGTFLALLTYLGSYFFYPSIALMFTILLLNIMVPIFDYFGNYYELKYCNEFA